MPRLIMVVPYGSADSQRKPYAVSQSKAEAMVARGTARWDTDSGLRRLLEIRTSARGQLRHWRKVQNRTALGAPLYSSMQLVAGVSSGRNTGSRLGKGTTGR